MPVAAPNDNQIERAVTVLVLALTKGSPETKRRILVALRGMLAFGEAVSEAPTPATQPFIRGAQRDHDS